MKLVTLLVAMVACTLPAIAQSDETAKSFHLLPHLADGGGWQSVLLVTNVSQSESRCTFNVYGVPLNRFRDFDLTGSTATFQLEGFGGYLIWDTKNELAAVASGYATLDCSAPVVAQVVFASYEFITSCFTVRLPPRAARPKSSRPWVARLTQSFESGAVGRTSGCPGPKREVSSTLGNQ